MECIDFKRFMFEQKIKQSDLAKYLGVSEGYISQVACGKKQLSEENYSKVLNNPYGWDTSMLKESPQPKLIADQVPSLSNTEILLRDLLAERDNEIKALNEIIWELKEEIGSLKNQLEHKGETARGAGGSSVANVG